MEITCPVSFTDFDRVLLGHGSGGKLSRRLIDTIFYPAFKNEWLEQNHDGCVFPMNAGKLACSTDSFVVDPIFFPGGNIGDLAVNGTVNDLACCGADPMFLTVGFILEEGLPLSDLQKIVYAMKIAAEKADVRIIAGDTKVVAHGQCDKLFINTSGIGAVPPDVCISPSKAEPGDVVICSGNIGVHGITILSTRESLGFETTLESDTASLNKMTSKLVKTITDVHVLRDPTRGGVGTTLNEIAEASKVKIELDEARLPVPDAVRAASEILGLDPLYIANEGILLVILPEKHAGEAVALLQQFSEGRQTCVIGRVLEPGGASVSMKTIYGNHRIVTMLTGEQLPRIC
ncbi:MAG: hydrogenase expression/formation protein HypE [Candidatus Azobacteroides sp.]|nr:hydrogenase expression/formation protein HypE [Candidatus Azobacteroides sp.]